MKEREEKIYNIIELLILISTLSLIALNERTIAIHNKRKELNND